MSVITCELLFSFGVRSYKFTLLLHVSFGDHDLEDENSSSRIAFGQWYWQLVFRVAILPFADNWVCVGLYLTEIYGSSVPLSKE